MFAALKSTNSMGIIERKEREREEMRRLILEAALRLFLENGFDKVSIRNIADAIEYSPATIYLYFKDKNELLFALHQQAFQKMIADFEPLRTLADPFGRLVEMGHIYLRFAQNNPELFDLMFIMTAPMDALECRDDTQENIWDDGHRAFSVLVEVVQTCIDAKLFKQQNARIAAMAIWSFVHGLAALFLRKRLDMFSDEERPELMTGAYDTFVGMMRTGL